MFNRFRIVSKMKFPNERFSLLYFISISPLPPFPGKIHICILHAVRYACSRNAYGGIRRIRNAWDDCLRQLYQGTVKKTIFIYLLRTGGMRYG